MIYKTTREQRVGKFILIEKDIFEGNEYIDTICEVSINGNYDESPVIYCSIPDALHHQCEWFMEN